MVEGIFLPLFRGIRVAFFPLPHIKFMELDNLLLLRGLLYGCFFVSLRDGVKNTIKLGANLILIAIHK